jgi:hypothetical protein
MARETARVDALANQNGPVEIPSPEQVFSMGLSVVDSIYCRGQFGAKVVEYSSLDVTTRDLGTEDIEIAFSLVEVGLEVDFLLLVSAGNGEL